MTTPEGIRATLEGVLAPGPGGGVVPRQAPVPAAAGLGGGLPPTPSTPPSSVVETSPGYGYHVFTGDPYYRRDDGTWEVDTLGARLPQGILDDLRETLGLGTADGGAYDPLDALRAQLALSEEQRAQEMHPLEMEAAGVDIQAMQQQMELDEREMERRILDDRFERAQMAQESAYLAESLAHAKRRDAVSALRDMTEYLVPAGMEYIPGMEPGGLGSQVFGQAGMDYTATPIQPVASVDFSQMTQSNPQMDAAVQYLLQLEQQNRMV